MSIQTEPTAGCRFTLLRSTHPSKAASLTSSLTSNNLFCRFGSRIFLCSVPVLEVGCRSIQSHMFTEPMQEATTQYFALQNKLLVVDSHLADSRLVSLNVPRLNVEAMAAISFENVELFTVGVDLQSNEGRAWLDQAIPTCPLSQEDMECLRITPPALCAQSAKTTQETALSTRVNQLGRLCKDIQTETRANKQTSANNLKQQTRTYTYTPTYRLANRHAHVHIHVDT